MSRLIDADELIKGFDLCIDTADDTASVLIATTFKRIVNKQPTIEPKRGTWYERYSHEDGERDGVRCGECGTHYYFDGQLMNYCPNCGADMREGEAE